MSVLLIILRILLILVGIVCLLICAFLGYIMNTRPEDLPGRRRLQLDSIRWIVFFSLLAVGCFVGAYFL